MQPLRRYLEKNTESQAFQACSWLESLRASRPTQTAPSAAATSRSRLTAGCTHTPCDRVIASSLRLSHTAAALWSLRSSHQSNAKAAAGAAREPWRSESDALLRAERPRLCGLCSFSSKDSGKLQTVSSYEDAWSAFFSKYLQKQIADSHPAW